MMFAQLRRDPLVGWPIAKWTVIAALNASVVFGVFTGMMAWYGGAITPAWASTVTTALLIWFPLGFIFFQGPFGRRCCDLDLGLPIHAKRLWLSHLIMSVLGGGILLITWVFFRTSSSPYRGCLAISRYQSQNSCQTKW